MSVLMRRKGNSLVLLVGIKTGAATLEYSIEVPQKVKNRTTLQPAVALHDMYPKYTNLIISLDSYTPMFIATMSTVAKICR